MQVATTEGAVTALDEGALEGFKANLRGELVRPSDDGYDAGRKIFNAMVDKRPAMIVRCAAPAAPTLIRFTTLTMTNDDDMPMNYKL